MREKRSKGLSLWIVSTTGVMLSGLLYASTPVWTYSSPIPASAIVSSEETSMVQYTVTNQSVKSKNLILQSMPGVSASSCYLAGKGSTCSLTLTINGSLLPKEGIHSGPILCDKGNPNQCYQPAASNQLKITGSLTAGHLLLSEYGSSISSLTLSPGDEGTLVLSNTGGSAVSSLSIQFPFGWESYFTEDNCLPLLAPQQSCTIKYTIPTPSAVGVLNPFIIQGSGADNSITLPVSIQAVGPVNCWGANNFGQLGNGITTNSNIPVFVDAITNAVSITGGLHHTCALLSTGAVNCWGSNNDGQLGNGTTTNSNIPVFVDAITNAVSITGGLHHTCALLSTGAVNCWGSNSDGQLGNGTTTSSNIPVPVDVITNALSITGGYYHTCALLSTGAVNCWGSNDYGQLGNGTTTSSNIPVSVDAITNAVSITGGGYHTCALLSTGAVNCWGNNSAGQLGNGTTTSSNIPVSVDAITNAVSVTAGQYHTCALLSTGTVHCWGNNIFGQLGNGTTTSSNIPVPVEAITNAVSITGGAAHTCALLSTGTVNCWGNNDYGQLGNGTTTSSNIPTPTCSESGCSSDLNALGLFNHNLGFSSCAIVAGP